jgi:hypothetical integral membrane protein (TIGR02206 family)
MSVVMGVTWCGWLSVFATAPVAAPTDGASTGDGASSHGFEPFTPLHGAVIVGWALLVLLAVTRARVLRARDRADGGERERRFTRRLGWVGVGAWVFNTSYWLLPHVASWRVSLPIHVCDLTLLVLPIALIKRTRWSWAALWFIGVGLSSQGLVTPVVRAGPETGEFWNFWIGHGGVVGAGFYLVFGLGYRPGWRDYGFACAAMTAYLTAMLAINIPTGWNYGYVGTAPPEQETIINALGPWPLRLLPLSALAAFGMFLLLAPFIGPWGAALRRRGEG